ncbi:MAG TPA: thioredoxin domain-containing protein [Syntrophorhabdaceae bacterium]|nr:thioredoxin domain-containing protein [Syntrophorhabdaceae bacterium]HQM80191.1 thioredoxin domain-containing protein [Syntrophorhabdaceae bacterium]
MNRLAKERSAYLQHAASQKIDWFPWSEEAFEKAKREGKPVFLSSGAIWCHWCHVMAKESFYDDEVAGILNENFIAIKLDRDERPDIDRRYQRAVAAMGFSGGWPLSIFLTDDKKPFYGGTYFPPVDMYGRTGFKTILRAISELYRTKKDEINEQSGQFIAFLNQQDAAPGEIGAEMTGNAAQGMISYIDKLHGGFGKAPKFPMSGAIEFLLSRYFLTREEHHASLLKRTLDGMANGGFHDQIGGGFHRYSTDEAWAVPHFEKMADDNAWLLRNYIDAYSVFGDARYREVAEGILRFVDKELSHPDGGFYASMDADVTPDDEGGYFTWTDEDLKRALNKDEYKILSLYFTHPLNAVHHNPEKKVLSVVMSIEELSGKAGMDKETVIAIIRQGKAKLLAERDARTKPFIDKALYTSLNGMMISAYLKAYRVLQDEAIRDFALKSLGRVMELNAAGDRLFHSEGVKALLEDYVNLTDALLSAYETTGNAAYLEKAQKYTDRCVELFHDKDNSGFFDTDDEVIGTRLKGVEDIPRPSSNALAIMILTKLSLITGDDRCRRLAEMSLKLFSPQAQTIGLHAGYYFCAMDAFFHMLKLDISAEPMSPLAMEALRSFYPYTAIRYSGNSGTIIPCVGNTCYEPICAAEDLKEFLQTFLPGKN